ncbi:MAG: hypothetical protein ACK5GZ_15200 [Cyanobium sp.]|jgi:hypothetical protein
MAPITRFLAAASLIALLAACGGEGSRDREDGPADRDTPSLGSPQDGDADDEKDEKDDNESRAGEDGDAND